MASHCPSTVSRERNEEYLKEVACPKSEVGEQLKYEPDKNKNKIFI